jgi:hypothetical protein
MLTLSTNLGLISSLFFALSVQLSDAKQIFSPQSFRINPAFVTYGVEIGPKAQLAMQVIAPRAGMKHLYPCLVTLPNIGCQSKIGLKRSRSRATPLPTLRMSDPNSIPKYLSDIGAGIDIPAGTEAFYTPLEVPPALIPPCAYADIK